MTNWFKVVGLLLIPAVFYTLASFLHLKFSNMALWTAIFMSIGIASVEYGFKVPIIRNLHDTDKVSSFEIQIVWVILTLILSFMVRWIMPDKKSPAKLVTGMSYS